MSGAYEAVAGWARAGFLPAIFVHTFMIRGLLGALLLGPLFGGLGTLVVARRMSFFTQAIGNAAMTGTALGLLLGEPPGSTWAGLYGFCFASAILVTFVQHRGRVPSDTVTGLFLAQTLGLGVLMVALVSKRFDIHQIEGTLFGSLLTLRDADLAILLATAALAALAGGFLFNDLVLASLSPSLAAARGKRPALLDYVFVTLATAVVVAGLKLVGALLVLVMIVVPAAAAQNVASNLRQFFFASVALSTLAAAGGLFLSGFLPVPTGGAIALVSTALFYLTLAWRPLRRRREVIS